jgi:tryptophan synthase alpha chain
MKLKTPQIVGFGISNKETFSQAVKTTNGAIIGSAFVKFISENPIKNIPTFIKSILD